MDAKPQKPLWGFRVHDENAPPPNANLKTLHGRNKSSPALSTMVAKGAAPQQPLKRTAFGDVSNIANAKMGARDDMILSGKDGKAVKENIGAQIPEKAAFGKKASAPLLRPAQRPHSLATGLKGLISNVVPGQGASKAPSNANEQLAGTTIPKLSRLRRNTVNVKDPVIVSSSTENVKPKEDSLAVPEGKSKPQRSMQSVPESSAVNVPATVQTTKVETNQKGTSQPHKDDQLSTYDHVYREAYHVPRQMHEPLIPRADAGSLQHEVIKLPVGAPIRQSSILPQQLPAPGTALLSTVPESVYAPMVISEPASRISLPPLADQDGQWEDELDEEEEWRTAYSINATTVIVPQFNQNVRREIAAAKEIIESRRTPEDFEDDFWDTTMVSEYNDEIFEYMRDLEIKMLPNPHYMDHQTEIQWSMRSVLMDWLVQVHGRFGLLPETLFLCVNYIDRFLSCKVVSLGKLQLVGATAIFVAAKYEEINCPSVGEIVYMVDQGYSIEEILKAERFMLGMLQFELGWPGPMSFLRRISKADDYDLETRTLAKYFLEITIMDERFLGCPPSFAAAGAHCLARLMLKKGPWSTAHVYYSNYTYSQLHPLVQLVLECCEDPVKHHGAVYEKYLDKRYKCASHYVRKEIERGFRLMDISMNREQSWASFYSLPSGPTLPGYSRPPSYANILPEMQK